MKTVAAMLLISVGGLRAAQALTGDWGGLHVSLQLTSKSGTAEFDCAHGELNSPVVPDRNGRFDVPGTFIEDHGGPARLGEPTGGLRVRYSGRVTNGRMTLSVTRTNTDARLGSFTLERGREPALTKCR